MSEAMDAKPVAVAEPLLSRVVAFWLSSVGAKVAMALTGLIVWGFIVGHLGGNLLIYLGPDVFNHYSEGLKSNGLLLWGTRITLLIAFPLHIFTAIRTSMLNRAARPTPYAYAPKTPIRPASQWALYSGLGLLCFLIFHLAHFTWHSFGPAPMLDDGNVNAYQMVLDGFRVPGIALIYIVGQLLLAGHLGAGIYGIFQHLGLWGPSWTPFAKKMGDVIGYGVAGAFISIPIAVLANLVHP